MYHPDITHCVAYLVIMKIVHSTQ